MAKNKSTAPVVKTTAPSGLGITRSGDTITFSWTIADKDYSDGLQFYWNVNGKRQGTSASNKSGVANLDVKSVSINKKINLSGGSKFTSTAFGVRGNSKTKKKSGKKKRNPGWSDWSTKAVSFTVPDKPSVSFSLAGSEDPFAGTFSWTTGSSDWQNSLSTTFKHCWRTRLQRIFVKNWNSTSPPGESYWKKTTSGWYEDTRSVNNSTFARADSAHAVGEYSFSWWVRVRSEGTAGNSAWAYSYHTFAMPYAAKNVKATLTRKSGSNGYICNASWTAPETAAHPIEEDIVQYKIAVPVTTGTKKNGKYTVNWSIPDGGWSDAGTVHDTGGADALAFSIDEKLNDDQLVFVRVNTKHDYATNHGQEVIASGDRGALPEPTNVTINPAAYPSTRRISITATNPSNITASYIAVHFRTESGMDQDKTKSQHTYKTIGIIPHGETQVTVQAPAVNEPFAIGLETILADYTEKTVDYGTEYELSNIKMRQNKINWEENKVPMPPNVECSAYDSNTIRVIWDWDWKNADQSEITWADHEDAWESTDQPQSYIVDNIYAGQWNIKGVDVGTWYVRVRLIEHQGDNVINGLWSETKVVKLSSAPAIPALVLSEGVVTPDGEVTCYWGYVSTDGTAQKQADICEVTYDGDNNPIYGDILTHTTTSQHLNLSVKDYGWQAGEIHYLAVRVISVSGEQSQGWSSPVALRIAEKLSCEITETSLIEATNTETIYEITGDVDIISDKTYFTRSGEDTEQDPYVYTEVIAPVAEDLGLYYEAQERTEISYTLDRLPLTVTAIGAGKGGKTTISIIRSDSYHMKRPDESDADGYKDEAVYIKTFDGEGTFTVDYDDLIGYLDDKAPYYIVATVKQVYDDKGEQTQTADSLPVRFTVHWEHQAVIPTGTCTIDPNYDVAIITPLLPDGVTAEAGDVCDIYRLSVDPPQLIFKGAEFGERYVDPYPTIGSTGGYRLVYRTKYGDYITEDGEIAFFETSEIDSNVDYLDVFTSIINFGTGRVSLPYNLSLNSKWQKDFQQTSYLGGHVQGDWNAAVIRSGTINSVGIVTSEYGSDEDLEVIETMRRLARYSGICHVRTPDGSSYAANVNVSEDREEKWVTKLAKYTLDISVVDSQTQDGMSYIEWQNSIEDEE